jgi:hypothetical protein
MEGGVAVGGRVFTGEVIAQIHRAVEEHPDWARCRLAQEVCDWLDWRGPNGRRKEMSCRKALLKLSRQGLITLPAAKRKICFRGRSVQDVKLDVPPSLEVDLNEIKKLELVLVQPGEEQLSAQWNKLLSVHHPLGYRPLAGAQLRYLIRSEHGYLGALGFRSAAFRSKARERWIGWSDAARQAYLPQVVCNARFVIARGVKVKNLASRVLSMATDRLQKDWQQAYGVVPLLVETYVDTAHHSGSCYRAANWQYVGSTRASAQKSRKAIFAFALQSDFRQRLCEEPGPARLPEAVALQRRAQAAARHTANDWVAEEWRRARLGDRRLEQRLRTVTRSFHEQPEASIPQACGSWNKTRAAYRFFKAVSMDPILSAHYEASAERIAEQKPEVVLAVNDSTTLNYADHPATTGLGPINNKRDKAQGLWMHDTMVYNPAGTALGLIDVQVWARSPQEKGKAATRYERPIEEKESAKWLGSFAAAARLQRQLGDQTMVVSVGDREADIYELFVHALADPAHPKLLVRADCGERLLADGGPKVRDFLGGLEVAGKRVVQIPRHKGRPARTACLEVRFSAVALRPPKRHPRLGVVHLWAVYVTEREAPPGIEPIEWMLWTTVAVSNAEQAWEKVEWYRRRWGIEDFHRTLKSGSRIEDRQLTDAESLKSCLAVDLVVAWRIEYVKKLSREQPDLPCTAAFSAPEVEVLTALAGPQAGNAAVLSLREAVRLVARLGGFLGRKSDGEPGAMTLWRGLLRLRAMVDGWVLARQSAGAG